MKRIVLYCLILGGLLVVPVEKLDVGDLEPVQAVWAYLEDGELVLETDTKDKGSGQGVDGALADLEEHCKGIIYLDTAEFLLVEEAATAQIPELGKYLKGSVMVCQWDGHGEVKDAAKYMAAHEKGCKLKDWNGDVKLPVLELRNNE